MNIRKIVSNSFGGFDCEIESSGLGWIPFTASPDDVELFGREIYARISGGEFGVIDDYEPPIPVEDVNE